MGKKFIIILTLILCLTKLRNTPKDDNMTYSALPDSAFSEDLEYFLNSKKSIKIMNIFLISGYEDDCIYAYTNNLEKLVKKNITNENIHFTGNTKIPYKIFSLIRYLENNPTISNFLLISDIKNNPEIIYFFRILHKYGVIKNANFKFVNKTKDLKILTQNIEEVYEKNKNALGERSLTEFLEKDFPFINESEEIFEFFHEKLFYRIISQ